MLFWISIIFTVLQNYKIIERFYFIEEEKEHSSVLKIGLNTRSVPRVKEMFIFVSTLFPKQIKQYFLCFVFTYFKVLIEKTVNLTLLNLDLLHQLPDSKARILYQALAAVIDVVGISSSNRCSRH